MDNALFLSENYYQEAAALCAIGRRFGERGWCRATSGNFSAKIDDTHCLITQSGKDKSLLTNEDFMVCDFDGSPVESNCKPSAETPLHTRLYRLDASIGSVLHTHSVSSTLLSTYAKENVSMVGYEMQKALTGISSHEDEIKIQVFENDQNLVRLADVIARAWHNEQIGVPGFLIRGHGLYAWGKDAQDALRHVEGFEFLFECHWNERLVRL